MNSRGFGLKKIILRSSWLLAGGNPVWRLKRVRLMSFILIRFLNINFPLWLSTMPRRTVAGLCEKHYASILALNAGVGQLHALTIYPRKRYISTCWIGDRVHSRAGLDVMTNKKVPASSQSSLSWLNYPGSYTHTSRDFIIFLHYEIPSKFIHQGAAVTAGHAQKNRRRRRRILTHDLYMCDFHFFILGKKRLSNSTLPLRFRFVLSGNSLKVFC
jgi:hypothetical protein